MVGTGSGGTWSQDEQRLMLHFGDDLAIFEVLGEESEFLRLVNGFLWETNPELSLVDVELRRQRLRKRVGQ